MKNGVQKTLASWIGASVLLCSFGCAEEADPVQTPGPTMPALQTMAGASGQAMPPAAAGAMMTDQAAATDPAAGGPAADPNCPNYVGDVMGMAIDLPGCCMPEGVCGVISSLSMMCITSSMILADLMPGPACTP